TLAVLVIAFAVVGVTVSVIVALPCAARLPTAHVTVPALFAQESGDDVAETKVIPAGSWSLTVTPVAGDGPLLVTVNVKLKLLLTSTGLREAVLVIARSVSIPSLAIKASAPPLKAGLNGLTSGKSWEPVLPTT